MLDQVPGGTQLKVRRVLVHRQERGYLRAEQDPETFAVGPSMLLPSFGTDMPLIPIDIDPPDHQAYRAILLPLFTPMRSPSWNRQCAKPQANWRGGEAAAKGDVVDVSAVFARPMPTIIFGRLAGYPKTDWPIFDRWIDEIIYERTSKPEVASAASATS